MLSRDELNLKLARMRELDPELRVFGASTHRYKLNEPTQEPALTRFEEDSGARIPEDYRDFLLRFGDGGAGPFYGLLSLEQIRKEYDNEYPVRMIGNPFCIPESANSECAYTVEGTIPLCHFGCGSMAVIIAFGIERGNIWGYCNDDRVRPETNETPIYPENSTLELRLKINEEFDEKMLRDRSLRLTFWQWYEDWVDKCLSSSYLTFPKRKV